MDLLGGGRGFCCVCVVGAEVVEIGWVWLCVGFSMVFGGWHGMALFARLFSLVYTYLIRLIMIVRAARLLDAESHA